MIIRYFSVCSSKNHFFSIRAREIEEIEEWARIDPLFFVTHLRKHLCCGLSYKGKRPLIMLLSTDAGCEKVQTKYTSLFRKVLKVLFKRANSPSLTKKQYEVTVAYESIHEIEPWTFISTNWSSWYPSLCWQGSAVSFHWSSSHSSTMTNRRSKPRQEWTHMWKYC